MNSAFKLSGSSERPAQPGFIVINTQKELSIFISEPSKFSILSIPSALAPNKINNYQAITDKTSILIRLNSSKQIHAPHDANPLKNFATC